MKTKKYCHLSLVAREMIRDGLYSGQSARSIGRSIGVSHTTIAREIKRNRMCKIPPIRKGSRAIFCNKYKTCTIHSSVCKKCLSPYTLCKKCRLIRCHEACPKFELKECEITKKWPYICPSNCAKRKTCRLPKCSYSPTAAHKKYLNQLVSSREGINLTAEELEELRRLVEPLFDKGNSPYVCEQILQEKMKVSPRTLYRYIDNQDMNTPALKLKRKVRYKKRKKHTESDSSNIDVTGREYKLFLKLPQDLRDKVFQTDSVEGYRKNSNRIVTMHNPKLELQLMHLVHNDTSDAVVELFNYLEKLLGSREEFNRVFPIFLLDRGKEFADIDGMENSCLEPGKKRCKVYFCDPRRPDQKGSAEKNHEHIREVLPKGMSDFDALNAYDVATLCSNVNSYARKSLDGKTPYEAAEGIIPKELLNELGIIKIRKDEVQLNRSLLPHTQKRK